MSDYDAYLERLGQPEQPEPDELCPECDHPISGHDPKYGCEVEGGDRWVDGVSIGAWVARGPCGCKARKREISDGVIAAKKLRILVDPNLSDAEAVRLSTQIGREEKIA